ncbi:MAG: hypothetical protein WCW53_10040 [Syntrophales bacterium]
MEQSRTPIRPGLSLDVVDQNRHMKSLIYDVIDRRIIIAQTTPPLAKHNLNREVSLTFLMRKDGQPVRYGVQAKVTDFITNYKLSSSEVVAVGLEQKTRLDIYNLRLDFRVRPPADSNLSIEWKGQRLNIIDISVGGFQFSYRSKDVPEIYEEFKIALIIDEYFLELPVKVLRVTAPVAHDPDLHYVGAIFKGNSRDYERYLMRKILEIQRKLLIDGKLA